MDTNLILTLIGLAITIIAGVGGLIISLFSKISELKGRLDTLASENRLQDKVDKIHDESIRKLQQRATDLHDSTQAQLNHLVTDIAQQQTQAHTSLQVLKTQEASSLAMLTERAQQLVQQFQAIEQGVQQLRSTTEAESARLMAEIVQQRTQVKLALSQQETTLLDKVANQLQQVKQEIEQEVEALQQEKVSTRLASLEVQFEKLKNPRQFWWYQLDKQWQAIFKEAIKIKSEPTEDELVRILSLTKLDCNSKKLTSLEPLRALTGLQTLVCYYNHLTSLESLHGVKNLQYLWCKKDSFLSEPEIERFKKAAPSGLRVLSPSWSC